MKEAKTDYDALGHFHGKSGRSMRRMEEDSPAIFNIRLNEYKRTLEKEDKSVVIAAVSFKGGAGKSTLANSFGAYLGPESVVLNLDISQPAKDVNSCATIDYSEVMEQATVKQVLDKLKEKYKFILIDTPGEISEEFLEIVEHVNHFIVPFNTGKRARRATVETIDAYFNEHSYLKGNFKTYFVLNQYRDKIRKEMVVEEFKKAINLINISPDVKLTYGLSALKQSDAIMTMEERGLSIDELSMENRLAYRVAQDNITKLCSSMEKFFGLEG